MKITEFKEGDLIVRVKESKTYTSEPKYSGDPFIFCEIRFGKIYMMHLNRFHNYHPELFEEDFDKRGRDKWEFYDAPKILQSELMALLYKLYEKETGSGDLYKGFLYRNALRQLDKTVMHKQPNNQ